MAQQWNELDCPKCKNTIKAKALLCPHCGAEFTPEEADRRAKEHNRTMGIGCIGLTAIVALLWWGFSGDKNNQQAAGSAKAEVTTKPVKWDRAAILKNLGSCQAGGKVIQHFVDRRDRPGAYKAAIGSGNECSRAMVEGPEEPYECTEVAMYGTAHYNDYAESLDTLRMSPSVVERLKDGRRIFDEAGTKCAAKLTAGAK